MTAAQTPSDLLPVSGVAGCLEFWFDFASTYSYLSALRIEQAAAERGLTVQWKPFLLGPVFRALGWETSPFLLQKQKGAYMWLDMARQCRKYTLPWTLPTGFPRNGVLASRLALIGLKADWGVEFCRQVFSRNFADDQDIAGPDDLAPLLQGLGLPVAELLEQASSDSVRATLRRQTEDAMARQIFGAPTFFAGPEMFWGNDRLDDALDCAAALAAGR